MIHAEFEMLVSTGDNTCVEIESIIKNKYLKKLAPNIKRIEPSAKNIKL